MKFVFFGYDFSLGIAQRLCAKGFELAGVYTFECDNVFNFNTNTIRYAGQAGVPATQEKITAGHIAGDIDRGVTIFLAAGYPHKIPPIKEEQAYGVNLHPSYLPKGRGLMPTPYILTDHPEAAGITLHKISDEFDRGDILYQEKLTVSPQETVETYSARVALRAPDLTCMVLENLEEYWAKSTPQNEGDALYFPPPDDEMRLLRWDDPLDRIVAKGRAFGRFGCLCHVGHTLAVVYHFDVWEEEHTLSPGTIALALPNNTVVAVTGGFVSLKDYHVLNAG